MFYDRLLKKTISMGLYLYILSLKTKIGIRLGSRDEGQWSDPKVEPIWITATKQVVFDESDTCMIFVFFYQTKKSAVLFWPACHNEFNGTRPLIYSWSYTDAIPFREKIDNAVSYFRELPIQLVLLYHESVKNRSFTLILYILFYLIEGKWTNKAMLQAPIRSKYAKR